MAEVVAQLGGLAHMLLQDMVLVRLHLQESCAFQKFRVLQYDDRTPVKKHIDRHKHGEHADFEHGENPQHPSCVKRAVRLRYREYIEEEEDGRQRHCEVPYPRKAGAVHRSLEMMCGGVSKSRQQQEGDSKLEKGRLRRKL